MATLTYNMHGILWQTDLICASVSKLFVDMKKGTQGVPHAELRLVLVENGTDKWSCSIGSNPGLAVNKDSPFDITFTVRNGADTPADILMSFEFKSTASFLGCLSILRGSNSIGPPENLFQFSCIDNRGSRDVIFQWILRLNEWKIIDLKAHAVVMPPGRSLLGEPQLEFEKFITKDYTESGSGVIQTTEDIQIHRGCFYSGHVRATGTQGATMP
ncbi:unnamed protein product [Clonostachys solani]|uniref:Uncharacterized protein n=1 Tax=Clonostachys solani TaxID=160281 RepID=A0A9N9YYM5_9HYPO|nr:unnamed protein product [Clonostachys solani]